MMHQNMMHIKIGAGRLLQRVGHGRLAGLRRGTALLPLAPGRLQLIRDGRLHGGQVAVYLVGQRRPPDPGEDPACNTGR
jgi:hypothetical protein